MKVKMIFSVCFVLFSSLNYVQADGGDINENDYIHYVFDWDDQVRICGSSLADMLRAVCKGVYNDDGDNNEYGIVPGKTLKQRIEEGPATQCCLKFCPVWYMKYFCKDQSITEEHVIVRKRKATKWYHSKFRYDARLPGQSTDDPICP
uniref:Uncharacterized protein n=1 Tax=Sipha flava TaxID=143950 RepID=A0A2S2RAS2_9HEMI